MMTIEQIDEFRKRTHSSYEDAKYFLERNNGDVLDAIIDFERSKTGGRGGCDNRNHARRKEEYGRKFGDVLQKGFDTRIFVEDRNSVLFNIPVVVLLLLIPFWFIVLVLFIFFAMLGYKVSVKDIKSPNVNVNDMFRNISDKMKDSGGAKPQGGPENKPPQYPVPSDLHVPASRETGVPAGNKPNEPKKEDGYKEYTIE